MSTIKTNAILDASGGSTTTINGVTPNAYNTMGKNRIINGAMEIDQRNAGSSVTPSNGAYTLDRWQYEASQASKFTVQQNAGSITPPAGFINYLGMTVASAVSVSASDYFILEQRLEGLNVTDLAWGTSDAKSITLSFWVRSSLTGTFSGGLANSAYNRAYVFSYSINAANTWEQKTITIAGDTTGTWLTTNGVGIQLRFSLGAGSTYSASAGSWGTTAAWNVTSGVNLVGTSGATFYITGVQLELGSTATEFERRPYTTELQLCQRYCLKYDSSSAGNVYWRYGIGECISTTQAQQVLQYPVPMRATPTITTTGTASNYAVYSANTITACSAVPAINTNTNTLTASLDWVVASGLTAGRAAQLLSNNNNTSYITFSSEL